MHFTRKSMSEASKTIFKEQRELTKERILGNPALIIGTIGFLVILTAAVFVPLISLSIRMQCRYPSVSERPEERIYLEQMNLGEIFYSSDVWGKGFSLGRGKRSRIILCYWNTDRNLCKLF